MPDAGWSVEKLVQHALEAGADGAAVVTRDGIPVVDELGASAFSDSVCAMGAAALAAAESAFSGSRSGAVRQAWIEGPNRVALVRGLDSRLILIALLDAGADRAAFQAAVDAASQGIRTAAR